MLRKRELVELITHLARVHVLFKERVLDLARPLLASGTEEVLPSLHNHGRFRVTYTRTVDPFSGHIGRGNRRWRTLLLVEHQNDHHQRQQQYGSANQP